MKPVYFPWDISNIGRDITGSVPFGNLTLNAIIPITNNSVVTKYLPNSNTYSQANILTITPSGTYNGNIVITLTGQDTFGATATENVAIPNNSAVNSSNAYTVLSSITVKSVTTPPTAGNIQITVSANGFTYPFICDTYKINAQYAISLTNYNYQTPPDGVSVQYSLDKIPNWIQTSNYGQQPSYSNLNFYYWLVAGAPVNPMNQGGGVMPLLFDAPATALRFAMFDTSANVTGVILQQGLL